MFDGDIAHYLNPSNSKPVTHGGDGLTGAVGA